MVQSKTKLGRGEFKYPAVFEASYVLMEGMGTGTEELVERLRRHLETFGTGQLLTTEQMGEAATRLGSGLPAASAYGQSLLALGKTHKELAAVERAYIKAVTDEVLSVFEDWTRNKFAEFRREGEKLEKMRQDMDRAAGKAREQPGNAENKVAEEAYTADHVKQMGLVQKLLEQMPADLDLHKAAVCKLLSLQHTLHTNCLNHVDAFLKDIAQRL